MRENQSFRQNDSGELKVPRPVVDPVGVTTIGVAVTTPSNRAEPAALPSCNPSGPGA